MLMESAHLDHERYMRRALDLARTPPIALYRSVIVDRVSGEIVAEGANHIDDEHPLWHGETDAIDRCYRAWPAIDWSRLALYTTAEPCTMCMGAILWAGIGLVVYGSAIPTLVRLGFDFPDYRAAGHTRRTSFTACQIVGGVLETECDALFREWAEGRDAGRGTRDTKRDPRPCRQRS
jgi:tRNA(Arg) A34 adenosine deaminase TadA